MNTMSTQEIARMLCEVEAGQEEVNIAQMNEIVSKIPKLLFALGIEKALAILNHFLQEYAKEGGVHSVETRPCYRDGKPDSIEFRIEKDY